MAKIQIRLPDCVKQIIAVIQQAGYEAYAVGGCVRDSILGREPEDWDITTSATPQQVKALFRRTVDTGLKHGTVTVLLGSSSFEVTTYRIDGIYEDNRHPSAVTFTRNLTEDLKRRDFTINAMAYNEQVGLVDEFEGLRDMEQKTIRCVGNPKERFSEDALRMMRAVRFAAQLSYKIEADTKAAISLLASHLQTISPERIQTELLKLMLSDHPDYLEAAYETGITAQILPEFDVCMETKQNNIHHNTTVGRHILRALCKTEAIKEERLALLFHDMGKPLTKKTDEKGVDHFYGHGEKGEEMTLQIMKRLKFDNNTIHKVARLVRFHDYPITPDARGVRRAVARIGEDLFSSFLHVAAADVLAQSDYRRKEKVEALTHVGELYKEILAAKNCLSLKNLAVTGTDLIAQGMTPGKEMGQVLQGLLEDVIDNPEHNQREYLLHLAAAKQQGR